MGNVNCGGKGKREGVQCGLLFNDGEDLGYIDDKKGIKEKSGVLTGLHVYKCGLAKTLCPAELSRHLHCPI